MFLSGMDITSWLKKLFDLKYFPFDLKYQPCKYICRLDYQTLLMDNAIHWHF